MTIKTSQILMQIAALQQKISMLADAQNQIAKCQDQIAQLQTMITPDIEPDAATVDFVNSQIAVTQAALTAAATPISGAKVAAV